MARSSSPDRFYANTSHWQDELARLRRLLLETGMEETMKWGFACYTHDDANVVGVVSFKSYFGLWFFQGALLEDSEGVLVNAQAGKTKALRQWRMHSAADIRPTVVRRYLREAMKLAASGETVAPSRDQALSIPSELQDALDRSAESRAQFSALRPAQQREYANYIADAKRAETRLRRLEKVLPMIASGVGLNDRYR